MRNFIGYHNEDEWGEFIGGRGFTDASWFTAKPFRRDTLIGNRLWAIIGRGTPRRYYLANTGVIYDVSTAARPESYSQPGQTTGLSVHYYPDFKGEQIELTDRDWFRTLRDNMRNFSLGLSATSDEEVIRQLELIPLDSLRTDIAEIRQRSSLSPTQRQALVEARLGQGKFRNSLLAKWNSSCAVTECSIPQVLRASHIVPWRDANDVERLDPDNGLLLVAHIDALFDANLVTFIDDGSMRISDQIDREERKRLGLPMPLRLALNERQRAYLYRHNTKLLGA